MDKILGIVFTVLFAAAAFVPLYFILKTDRELSRQIEALRRKLEQQDEEINQLNQKENEQ